MWVTIKPISSMWAAIMTRLFSCPFLIATTFPILSIFISSTRPLTSRKTISLTRCSCPGAPATSHISANNFLFFILFDFTNF